MSAETPAYVSFCPTCSGMTGCIVDDAEVSRKDISHFVASVTRRGNRVEHLTVGYVREYKGEWCNCKRKRGKRAGQMEAAL